MVCPSIFRQVAGMHRRSEQPDNIETSRPEWFATLLADGEDLSGMALAPITVDTLRTAFARYAETHEAASIQRCWSTWNVLCAYHYTAERIRSNPMPMVG